MITPPIKDGLLNGCYREFILTCQKIVVERSFGINELMKSKKVIIFNSVRKELEIKEIVIGK